MTHNLGWQDDKPRAPMPIRMEVWKKSSGADRALVSDQAATRLDPSGFDHGYWLGVYVPRALNRIADRLVFAVFIALLPVCFAVWMDLL